MMYMPACLNMVLVPAVEPLTATKDLQPELSDLSTEHASSCSDISSDCADDADDERFQCQALASSPKASVSSPKMCASRPKEIPHEDDACLCGALYAENAKYCQKCGLKRQDVKDDNFESLAGFLEGNATTLVLFNLPREYTLQGLLDELVDAGFHPQRDLCFLHLPVHPKTKLNFGHSVISFTNIFSMNAFITSFNGKQMWLSTGEVVAIRRYLPPPGLELARNAGKQHDCVEVNYGCAESLEKKLQAFIKKMDDSLDADNTIQSCLKFECQNSMAGKVARFDLQDMDLDNRCAQGVGQKLQAFIEKM